MSDPVWDNIWIQAAKLARSNPAPAYRRKLIFRELEDVREKAGLTLLDAGCGPGEFLWEAASWAPKAELVGVDFSEGGLDLARHILPSARFICADLTDRSAVIPGVDPADVAICSEVVEHIVDPRPFLETVRSLMRPGGRLVVTVPAGPMSANDRFMGHVRHYTAANLKALLESAGFQGARVKRAGFPFFNIYRLLVILRGRRMSEDMLASGRGERPTFMVRIAMGIFLRLLPLSLRNSLGGWQLLAIAEAPHD